MFAHPWKDEDLVVDDESEELDEYYLTLVDKNQFCDCCGELKGDCSRRLAGPIKGDCACSDWGDDCWVGVARPWGLPFPESPVELSAKGKRLRAEVRSKTLGFIFALHWRANIRKARRHWMVLKDAVDARRIALYWQEQTQRGLCAPGGAGRAADAEAFAAEV